MTRQAGVKPRLRGRTPAPSSKYANYRPRWLRRFLAFVLRVAFRLTMRLKVVDLHHFPMRGGCIVMINHIAFLDPVLISGAFPRPVISMAKAEAYDDKLIGPLIRIFDAFPVNRGDVDRRALKTAFDVLDNGLPLLIAPEGTRSPTVSLGEAHQGLAYIAAQTGVPVVPVAISGSDQWKHNVKRFRRTPIRLRVGAPFYLDAGSERLTSDTLKRMTDEAMYAMACLLPPEQRGIYSNLGAATTVFLKYAGVGKDSSGPNIERDGN
jgi:1-acyl-sn-glycerol-3-phosphate acyltransferase